jgi:pre-mRNA-splicing factor 38A
VSRAPQIPDCSIVVPRRGRADDDGPLEDGEHRAHIDTDGTDHPDPEIAEANRLRAALGLKPLRP